MPEGDTILRTARTLSRAIGGQVVTRFESTVPGVAGARLTGQRVERVDAAGKNLLITFEDGRVLRTHMMMTGAWHIYRPGERWRKSPGAARVVIEAGDWLAVCFAAPVVELVREGGLASHAPLSTLGPDVLADGFDVTAAAQRIAGAGQRPIGEVLLDQTVIAGVGNVYKSECLFLGGIHPRTPAAAIPIETLVELVDRTARLMRANLTTSARRTRGLDSTSRERLWVYRRRGEPCARCATPVDVVHQGEARRSTYYCPRCQVASR
ncbi:Fpg/Nei family DNA glycosylase [Myxococcota bacterium]|nr:Fpg/Nei family DNA glycosylase [Myxococcota bacterium]